MIEKDDNLHGNVPKMEEHIKLVNNLGNEVSSVYQSSIERLFDKEVSKIGKGNLRP
jgi:hypothetical protein